MRRPWWFSLTCAAGLSAAAGGFLNTAVVAIGALGNMPYARRAISRCFFAVGTVLPVGFWIVYGVAVVRVARGKPGAVRLLCITTAPVAGTGMWAAWQLCNVRESIPSACLLAAALVANAVLLLVAVLADRATWAWDRA